MVVCKQNCYIKTFSTSRQLKTDQTNSCIISSVNEIAQGTLTRMGCLKNQQNHKSISLFDKTLFIYIYIYTLGSEKVNFEILWDKYTSYGIF